VTQDDVSDDVSTHEVVTTLFVARDDVDDDLEQGQYWSITPHSLGWVFIRHHLLRAPLGAPPSAKSPTYLEVRSPIFVRAIIPSFLIDFLVHQNWCSSSSTTMVLLLGVLSVHHHLD
jgi:hypothetical protein